ncbi:uracil phosphoribosyltransferase [Moheibacter lacus]|uniref:Uracil phosphoribosyltransferase n=1 Tax=Moheibacter lacus TaxID=2745851 RepID=A0A838ZGY7_9FLAO|nr:uracil phosphoribosyltransferase [Moheibacter lacus]MBA5628528.1 uracil phosphoribosyltransferase [Moheibacter lacus]
MKQLHIIQHPLILSKMTQIRRKETPTKMFKELVNEIASLMCYEITRDLETETFEIETPICKTTGYRIKGEDLVLVPILRAGLGMVEGIQNLIPNAKTGHIGIYRDHDSLEPVEYLCKLPPNMENRDIIILDPMLATGGSAVKAIEILKAHQVKSIRLACLVGCPEGVELVHQNHPEIPIFLAAMDEKLNEKGYIVPGLGDAGDRLFGTN